MGRAIRDAVRHLNGALGDVAYNLGFHTAPHEHGGLYHWHVHLWPNLVTAAGFERGTGVMINVMPPETGGRDAAAPSAPRRDADPRRRGLRRHRRPRVWAAVEQVDTHVDWMADAEVIRFMTDRTAGVGTRFECVTKVGPIRLTDRMEITEWDPGRAMGVRHTGLVTGTGRFTITPLDGGRRSRFAWEEDLHVPVVARRPRRRRHRRPHRDAPHLGRQPAAARAAGRDASG